MYENTFYITTPIYYPSDKLHIGHSYCTVATDTMARYKRMQGFDVMFLTGTDEHGQKIEQKAKEAGVTPKQYVDNIVSGIHDLWKLMNISHDRFIRTTDDYHVESVQKIFRTLYDKGDIYKGVYKGKYCTPCESFWTESQLVDGKCPDCGRPVVDAEEEAYFFKLSKYADRIRALFEDDPNFLLPVSRANEMMNNFIKPGLEDLCVSRTSFSWGIPVDFDPGHVVYVWVDALSNYITALGYLNEKYDDYDKYWPATVQFVGKEITRFHTIIWPAMLMALDLPLPKQVFSHGWLLLDGGKMSKSKGNVVDPVVLAERYGVDALRYFLLREFPFGTDGNFSNELLLTRINSDLANDLGNLVSRTLSMVDRYFSGTLPTVRKADPLDDELAEMVNGLRTRYEEQMDVFAFQAGLVEVFKLISRANKYIDETAPWVLGKDAENAPRLASVLYTLLEVIRVSTIFLQPFMPETCEKIFSQLGVSGDLMAYDSTVFGKLPLNAAIVKGDNLFPRIDVDKELDFLQELSEKAREQAAKETAKVEKSAGKAPEKNEAPVGVMPVIGIDEFSRMDLRVAKVLDCMPVPKADKLLLFKLDDGEKGRQIVSGIAKFYKPEDLIGKKVVIIANLKPVKLRGELSEGMILSSVVGEGDDEVVTVLLVDDSVPPGAKIR